MHTLRWMERKKELTLDTREFPKRQSRSTVPFCSSPTPREKRTHMMKVLPIALASNGVLVGVDGLDKAAVVVVVVVPLRTIDDHVPRSVGNGVREAGLERRGTGTTRTEKIAFDARPSQYDRFSVAADARFQILLQTIAIDCNISRCSLSLLRILLSMRLLEFHGLTETI